MFILYKILGSNYASLGARGTFGCCTVWRECCHLTLWSDVWSGIYLTVKSRLCLWFKAVCADPISFYTKQMQRLEMDCSVFTEAHRSVFSPCHLFFSSVSFGLHSFFSFWRNLHSWSYLPLGLLYGRLLVHLSLAGRSVGGCKPTENMGMPKQ